MKKEIILIGGGGHCMACIDVIEQAGNFRISGIVDVPEKLHQKILGYEIIATDEDLSRVVKEYPCFLITIGQIRSPQKRITLFNTLKELNACFPVIVSPHSYVSKHAHICEGTIVMHHALVNAGARVGANCIINSKALVEHDVEIGDHCHIATGAVVNGGVRIDGQTFIGSNAVIREYIQVGDNSVIGAGEKIITNISPAR
jgi:sugar O-acyltransferase (sialic acid O-acetyltransferase NeuD family)